MTATTKTKTDSYWLGYMQGLAEVVAWKLEFIEDNPIALADGELRKLAERLRGGVKQTKEEGS